MKSRFLLGLLAVFALGGCTSSTGILPLGSDTYTVTERLSPILGGGTKAEKIALTEATDYCEQHGRKFFPTKFGEGGGNLQWGGTGYTVTFRCFLPSDPELMRLRSEQLTKSVAAVKGPRE